MIRHRGGGSSGRRHVRFCKDNHDEFHDMDHVDNHDDTVVTLLKKVMHSDARLPESDKHDESDILDYHGFEEG